MINAERITSAIEQYKQYFPNKWAEEQYKWEAVKQFQSSWNIEASDFVEMLKKSLSKTGNLLGSGYAYPRKMIEAMAESDSDAVKAMFINLFDESKDLAMRIESFINSAEVLREKYNKGSWKNHFQNTNAVTTYLWLMYPDKYYIYKYELYKKAAEELDDTYRPKGNGSVSNVIDGFKMYDEIRSYLKKDDRIRQIFNDALTDQCYSDKELVTLTIDFGFYIARYYETNSEQWYPSSEEYDPGFTVNDWVELLNDTEVFDKQSIEVIDAMYKNGGEGTCKELADKYGKDFIFYRNTSINLGRRIHKKTQCPIIKNSNGGSSWWTIPYIGKIANKKQPGSYTWKLRDELKEAYELICIIDTSAAHNTKKYWIYSPGANASMWEEFYNEGIMGIYWDELTDLKSFSNRDEIKKSLQEYYHSDKNYYTDTLATWEFANVMKQGDIVFAKKGLYTIVGCGVVASDYIYDSSRDKYKHIRKVKWTHKGEWQHPGQAVMKTLTEITSYSDYIQKLETLVGIVGPIEVTNADAYTKEDLLKEVFISEKQYDTLSSLLEHKKNVILQGAPGVGKSFTAKRLAYSLIGERDGKRIEFIQFHQSYSYEDFIIGYRPSEDGLFKLKEGVFYRFCDKARKDPERDYFFIIDEINRGNLSKIFGELLMLIEKDYRSETATLAYNNEKFSVPDNLYIIGMMNTADRSLAMIDYALRRRFSFFEMEPGFDSDGFKAYSDTLKSDTFDDLIGQIKLLNKEIENDGSLGKGFCIGHSYFCNLNAETCTNERLHAIVEYDIIPILSVMYKTRFDEIIR